MPPRRHVRRNAAQGAQSVVRIPQYRADPVFKRTLRFRNIVGASTNSITDVNLGTCYGCYATTNTLWSAFAGLKILRVRIWTMGNANTSASSPASTDISLVWVSSNGPRAEVSDSGTVAAIGRIDSKPPPRSLASFWLPFTGGGVTQFIVSTNIGDIVEVTFQFTVANANDPSLQQAVGSAGNTLGKYYYAPLDGYASGALAPVANPAVN